VHCYDIKVDGRILWNRTEEDVMVMFSIGAIDRDTPCRRSESEEWLVLNEFFPLLKYPGVEVRASQEGAVPKCRAAARRPTHSRKKAPGALVLLLLGGVIGAAATAFYHHSRAWVQDVPEHSGPLPLVTIATPAPGGGHSQVPLQRARISVSALGDSQPAERRQIVSASERRPTRSTPRPAAAPKLAREYTIPLNQYTTIHTEYGAVGVKIVDHGPVTFSVWINFGGERRIEKIKGFETTGTNITEIYAFPRARVYYVDRISVSTGYCVLKVIPN
jgi:hypothetical protein